MPTNVTVIIPYAHGVVLSDVLPLFYGWGGRSCAESAGSWLRVKVGRSNAREQRELLMEMWISKVPRRPVSSQIF